MSKKQRQRRAGAKRGDAKPALEPALIRIARSNGAILDRGEYEVVQVPNPYGEVLKDGQPVPHTAIKLTPQYVLLWRRKVITREQCGVLEWYADRLALSQNGGIRNPLDGSGGGGGAGRGIPINEAVLDAARDVRWARKAIGSRAMLAVFDAVMAEDMTFTAMAQNENARRYVTGGTRNREKMLGDLFKKAAARLALAKHEQSPQGPGKILASQY